MYHICIFITLLLKNKHIYLTYSSSFYDDTLTHCTTLSFPTFFPSMIHGMTHSNVTITHFFSIIPASQRLRSPAAQAVSSSLNRNLNLHLNLVTEMDANDAFRFKAIFSLLIIITPHEIFSLFAGHATFSHM